MKTIVFCFTILLMFFTLGTYAQQENSLRIHQVGITFTSLNQFGINYKTGNEKTLLRLSLLSLNLRNQAEWGRPEDSLDVKTQGYGVGFRLGFESGYRLSHISTSSGVSRPDATIVTTNRLQKPPTPTWKGRIGTRHLWSILSPA